ncbi:50S ribosomal protein L16 [Candidatus Beckwithbacteria bacterium RBG_13_42_9]|uniref:Large ribosomal subunit protein uL16 n=1 Tax=Candidatus Beckwithbacteria bacterium RBG_13_42_9 TaxID=1797457 RepID=A0A1F5E8T8_9BACT|nr:MAG: 50S ribosomal protein L16 [Candidatus Beckwithbacteria bacterium RBG_13_42_9]
MLHPKRQKYRKQFRGQMKGKAQSGNALAFGEMGLKALERSWITSQQIESARKAVSHATKRMGKSWVRIFPDKPYTKKAAGSRMGGGKGDIAGYVAVVRPGKVILEITGVTKEIGHRALWLAARKLPIATKLIEK